MKDTKHTTISVIGLGKLGACMAAAIASRGFKVIGVDVNEHTVKLVNDGRAPVPETGLGDLLEANHARIKATTSHARAILDSSVSFVIVPTPSDNDGAYSLQYALWAFKEIGKALRAKKSYHLVVMTSTVLPGSCRYALIPALEKYSGRKAGRDFGFCYSPEFIALGSVIRDFLNPDFTLVGENDARSGGDLEELYARIAINKPPCKRMSLENAELAKVALNSYVTMKITFANTLARICGRMPGGDIDAVTGAIGQDTRIGHRYLKGGLGFGGPCFPRDNLAFNFIAGKIGIDVAFTQVTDQLNRAVLDDVVLRIKEAIPAKRTIAVLGLAYKPCSPVIEQSQPVMLSKELSEAGYRVVAYDPLANENADFVFQKSIVVLPTVRDCLLQADAVVIATPDSAFQRLKPEDFKRDRHGVTIFDLWRILGRRFTGCHGIRYLPFGKAGGNVPSADILRRLWTAAKP